MPRKKLLPKSQLPRLIFTNEAAFQRYAEDPPFELVGCNIRVSLQPKKEGDAITDCRRYHVIAETLYDDDGVTTTEVKIKAGYFNGAEAKAEEDAERASEEAILRSIAALREMRTERDKSRVAEKTAAQLAYEEELDELCGYSND